MYGSKKKTIEIRSLRKHGGKWLKEQREKAGFSQRELAKELDLPYYTFISQVENGSARIPPEHYQSWATALKIPVATFVHAMLKYYDPVIFDLLFPRQASHFSAVRRKPVAGRSSRREDAVQAALSGEGA